MRASTMPSADAARTSRLSRRARRVTVPERRPLDAELAHEVAQRRQREPDDGRRVAFDRRMNGPPRLSIVNAPATRSGSPVAM